MKRVTVGCCSLALTSREARACIPVAAPAAATENGEEMFTEEPYDGMAAEGRGRSSTSTGRSTTSPRRGAHADAGIVRGRAKCAEKVKETMATKDRMHMEQGIVGTAERNGPTKTLRMALPGPPLYDWDT